MQITRAVPEDAPSIGVVHIRSWQVAYKAILTPEYLASMSVEARASRWHDILKEQQSTTLVVRHNNQVIGFVSYGRCRDNNAPNDQGEIWALYADPQCWRQGAGRELLNRALVELRASGFKAVSLWVLSKNGRGRAFYEACGFRRMPGSEQVFELGGQQVEEVKYLRENDA